MTKQKKSNNILIEEYLNKIVARCEEKMPIVNKTKKISDDKITIPTIKTYNQLVYNNYSVLQFKLFAKHYKLKITGNKKQLLIRLYSFYPFNFSIGNYCIMIIDTDI